MATDEEYLDSLLKSMTETEQQPRNMEDVMKTMNMEAEHEESFSLNSEDLADMLDMIEEKEAAPPMIEEIRDEAMSLYQDSVSVPGISDGEESVEEFIISEEEEITGISDFLQEHVSEEGTEAYQEESEPAFSMSEADIENMDVTELIDNMDGMPGDLLEINDLLKKADNNEYVEAEGDNADFLALLGGLQEEEITEENFFWGNEDSTETGGQGLPQELLEGTGKEEKKNKKEKKKKNKNKEKGSFGKKKKQENTVDDVRDVDKQAEGTGNDVEKKPGRLAKFFTYLTEEESEADENAEILEELQREDARKAKKNEKKKEKEDKKKSGKGNKKGKSEKKTAKEEKKREKKAKKEQKKQEKQEAQKREPHKKILSKKGTIVLVAFCASLIAAIFALSIFLPDYVDKNEAREAFYVGDYETVYKLLYGKKLNDNDRLIYERAESVLSLQRKLDSYENNKVLGRDAEALEALLQGMERYRELENASELGILEETDALYNQMCGILLNGYGLSPEDVYTILEYDDIKYSRTIYDLIEGKGFSSRTEAVSEQENGALEEILPEEEEMMQSN